MIGPDDQFPFPFPGQEDDKPAGAGAKPSSDEGLPAFPAIEIPVPAGEAPAPEPAVPPLPTTPGPAKDGGAWPPFAPGSVAMPPQQGAPAHRRDEQAPPPLTANGVAGATAVQVAGQPGASRTEPLSDEEVADLRRLLNLFGPRWLQRVAEGGLPLRGPGPGAEEGGAPAGPAPAGAVELPPWPAAASASAGGGGGSVPGTGLGAGLGTAAGPAGPTPTGPFPPFVSPLPPTEPAAPAAPVVPPETVVRDTLLAWFDRVPVEGVEREARTRLREVLGAIAPGPVFLAAWQAVTAAFPAAQALRFGTPDQKQFALSVATDRALTHLAGHAFPERGRLLKALAAWASAVAGSHTFLASEGEPFNNQYWERVPAASPTGKTIREVHGFLVIRSDSRQVVRLGRALT